MHRLLTVQALARHASLALACFLLFTIMLLGSADALSSNLLNYPIPVVLELSEVLLAASVFLALASASASGKHIAVDVITERMGPRLRALCARLALLIGLLIFGAVAWQAWNLAFDSVATRETASALIRFPIWPAKLLAAAGLTLATVQCLLELVISVRGSSR